VFLSFGRNAAEGDQVLRCLGVLVPDPVLGTEPRRRNLNPAICGSRRFRRVFSKFVGFLY